ncbi:uncharacterized protein LOC143592775 [Bidens hawaiensis]|uniref:uncharacterized protein LOC143592775 n=1 Tax=Bidens hawaiensis TaxID=980011 RepID=UPI0040499F0C
MWADLNERFGKESAPRAYELKQSLASIKQDGVSVSTYYTKLRVLWDEIHMVLSTPTCSCNGCNCGIGKKLIDTKDKEKLYEFLLGLDADFGTIRTQILAMQPIPYLNAAFHLVKDDEQQKAITGPKKANTEVAAFQTHVSARRDQANKPKSKEAKSNSGELFEGCTFCGKDGHKKEGCFKRIGYPNWWPGKVKQDKQKPKATCVEKEASPISGMTPAQYQKFVEFFGNKTSMNNKEENVDEANMAGTAGKEGKWVIDSGATEHITCDDTMLKNKTKRKFEPSVTIPNGDAILVEGRGDLTLPNGMKVKEVLYVPNFKCNLLSVSRLSQDLQCAITLFPEFCVMHGLRSRILIGVGDCKDGLDKVGMMGGGGRDKP